MANVTVTVAEFRQMFPAFSDTTKYSDTTIQIQLDTAQLYISPEENCLVSSAVLKQMIYLLTAHLLSINTALANGDMSAGGQVASASVGGVSVSKAIPKNRTDFEYFLNSTGYGMQLLALLNLQSVVGIYFGGQKENVFR